MIDLIDLDLLKIFAVFSTSPGSRLRRKILKEKTGMSNIILDKNLNKLVNFGFLVRENNLFSLNFENKGVREIIKKISENYNKFKRLPLKEYFIIFDIREKISKIKDIKDIYLFGSYAKLIFNEKSDIDLAVISDKVKRDELNKTIKKLEKKYKKNIEVHYFSTKFYNNKRDALVKEILQHGIKLV